MADAPLSTPDHNSDTLPYHQGSRDQSTSAFFLSPTQFTISGGVFTNNVTHVHQPSPVVPYGMFYYTFEGYRWRRIPLGDLNLLCDLDYNSGVISRRQGQCSIRRVYSARIPGCESNMTVAVYQGDKADEKWREDISKYANLRHPNIVQLYGVTICSGIRATVYHDDLIPWKHVEQRYHCSPIATVYIFHFASTEYEVRHGEVIGSQLTCRLVGSVLPTMCPRLPEIIWCVYYRLPVTSSSGCDLQQVVSALNSLQMHMMSLRLPVQFLGSPLVKLTSWNRTRLRK
ncbi:hypothetical protein GGX14DRAFT_427383 [Mycena pura]|uniref:Ig-like domain-containing protein n=1 Tax=Mycena pura TaxID=153505 RepID=A0AAD6YLX3_9AGAR|nr:hypothetical protein GGX14DRAFT_427383 [Mycena pura]